MYTGPHIIKDGLVFGYDTGYGVADNDTATRFYTGEPAVNLWDSLLSTQSLRTHTKHYWNGKKWTEDATYTHPGVDGPKDVYLGLVFKHVSGALNSSWSGTSYGYMLRDIACTNGATMTMSSWIYASGDCNVDAIPAVIEGESGGESTVTGYPASYDLNNKGTWQVTAKKATSDGNTRFIPLYPRKGGVTDGSFAGFFMWALPQVTYGDRVVTPIQPGATRSSTSSLIDLKETTDIDLSNLTFDSTGQPTFDGTNDYININKDFGTVDAYTFEWVENPGQTHKMPVAGRTNTNFYKYGAYSWRYKHGGTLGEYYHTAGATSGWHHWVVTYDGSTIKVFQDNISLGTNSSSSGTADFSDGFKIGWWSAGGAYAFNGDIPVMRIYDKALSSTEIKQNFNAYKNRFSI